MGGVLRHRLSETTPQGVVPSDPFRVQHTGSGLSVFSREVSRAVVELDACRMIVGLGACYELSWLSQLTNACAISPPDPQLGR